MRYASMGFVKTRQEIDVSVYRYMYLYTDTCMGCVKATCMGCVKATCMGCVEATCMGCVKASQQSATPSLQVSRHLHVCHTLTISYQNCVRGA